MKKLVASLIFLLCYAATAVAQPDLEFEDYIALGGQVMRINLQKNISNLRGRDFPVVLYFSDKMRIVGLGDVDKDGLYSFDLHQHKKDPQGKLIWSQSGDTLHAHLLDKNGSCTRVVDLVRHSVNIDLMASTFARRFRAAVLSSDQNGVAAMLTYPLEVSFAGKKHKRYKNQTALLDDYGEIFTPKLVKSVANINPKHLVKRNDNYMLTEHGEIWLSVNNEAEGPKLEVQEIEVL